MVGVEPARQGSTEGEPANLGGQTGLWGAILGPQQTTQTSFTSKVEPGTGEERSVIWPVLLNVCLRTDSLFVPLPAPLRLFLHLYLPPND